MKSFLPRTPETSNFTVAVAPLSRPPRLQSRNVTPVQPGPRLARPRPLRIALFDNESSRCTPLAGPAPLFLNVAVTIPVVPSGRLLFAEATERARSGSCVPPLPPEPPPSPPPPPPVEPPVDAHERSNEKAPRSNSAGGKRVGGPSTRSVWEPWSQGS